MNVFLWLEFSSDCLSPPGVIRIDAPPETIAEFIGDDDRLEQVRAATPPLNIGTPICSYHGRFPGRGGGITIVQSYGQRKYANILPDSL